MDDWKYKIVEIAEDMAGEDGLDYSELSDKDQLKYYGKAYEYYLDRPEKANGGIMRNFYREGDEVEEFQEDDLSEIELMKDQGIPYGEQVKAQDSGIMQMADRDPMLEDEYNKYRFDMLEQGLDPMDFDSFRREAMSDQAAIDPKIRIEEVVKEFIREKGRKPNSLDELKEFFEMKMGTAKDPGMEVVKELVEDDKTRITLAGGSFPDLNVDGEITQADILIGKGVIEEMKNNQAV